MYKCMNPKCGRMYKKLPENDDRFSACSCGSRIFVKVRSQQVRRVKAR